MDQAHYTECPAWKKLREVIVMTKLLDLVKLFQLMLAVKDDKIVRD
jgi:hypothetical protein